MFSLLTTRMGEAVLVWVPRGFGPEERALRVLAEEWLRENEGRLQDLLLDAYLRGEVWGRNPWPPSPPTIRIGPPRPL